MSRALGLAHPEPYTSTGRPMGDPRWRTGRKLGRTIYVQLGESPSDEDILIGVMDTVGLAAEAVEAYNAVHGKRSTVYERHDWEPNPRSRDGERPCLVCGVYEGYHPTRDIDGDVR